MNINNLKVILKNNEVTQNAYLGLREIKHRKEFRINSLTPMIPVATDDETLRLNLILPVFNKNQIYGGISTALKVFEEMMGDRDVSARIIITGNGGDDGKEEFDPKFTYEYKDFSHNGKKHGIYFLRENNKIEVGKNDYFMLSSWHTAYIFSKVFTWQCSKYGLTDRKYVYLIQDYEPGFYSWSTEYVLAESTYKVNSDKCLAIFNSKELFYFFKANGYSFAEEHFFAPVLNEKLAEYLKGKGNIETKREKKIIIYGRPYQKRNAYELLRYSLALWSKKYKGAKDWEIISLGEKLRDVKLKNNVIHFKGKLSLEEYAEEMLTAYAGISLMISPHPSYVPLELSTFGVKTITNSYANKDLSSFNENIRQIDLCTPDVLVKRLVGICEEYESDPNGKLILDNEYVGGNPWNISQALAGIIQ